MKLKATGMLVGLALLGSLPTAPAHADTALCKAGSIISNQTVDCEGAYISGGWCEGDDDGQAAVIILRNATIKNAKFAQGKAGKGIWCESGTCNVENVTFDEVCEDAVSTRKDGVTLNVKGSTFNNTMSNAFAYGKKPDKFIQVNAKNVKVNVSDSTFRMVPGSSSTPEKISGKAGKVVRTCGNCSGNAGPRAITLTNVKVYGPIDSIAGVNSEYRGQSSSMRDTVTIKNLKIENYSISGDKSTPPVCVQFEGLDKTKHSGDSPKLDQAWETASCIVKKSDVSKL
ncbi:conserved exported hypothetical protein [Pseudomonas sp. 8Z]|uniref:pectate lyase n=1 Tax=Pseudomonas sp. 8Z TaxID=2653166 RepID=UPI0012F44E98|nr:pectate lyase [Pseudomonas sp. 8Z]VXC59914.1 conserved exported hypothetical protein [Pseudomonas sp. 8Z]